MKHFSDSEVFIECLNDMDDVHKDIKEYNPNKIQKIFILFDDMMTDMVSNEKSNPIVTELFIREKKLNIYLLLYQAKFNILLCYENS